MQQTYSLVNCGQVVCGQICISPRHIQGGMAQRLLEVERATTPAKVIHGESMPEHMKCSRRWLKAQVSASTLHPVNDVVTVPQGSPASAENPVIRSQFILFDVAKECAA